MKADLSDSGMARPGSGRFLAIVAMLTSCLILSPGTRAPGAETPETTLKGFMIQRGYAPVPMKWDSLNHLLVQGKINGSRAVIQLDTGCPQTILDGAKAAKLKRVNKVDGGGGAHGSKLGARDVVVIPRMDLAGTVISNQSAQVMDLHMDREVRIGSLIPQNGLLDRKDLLLGLDFLVDTHAFLDCAGATLFLRAEEPAEQLARSMEESFRQSGYISVPLQVGGHLVVRGSVNGKAANFILDTGTAASDLDINQLDKFRLAPNETILESKDIGGRTSDKSYARLASLKLGDYEQKNVVVGTSDLTGLRSPSQGDEPPLLGLIGADLLWRARALIDCEGGKLYVKPGSGK